MAIQTTQDVTKSVTDRGTPIRKSNTEFDKNSFLKILSAQLSNLDPTQDQDSSAYVAQMAQFASIEQMANLNTTMSDSAYQQMLNKKVIINETYEDGTNVEGYVTEVKKKSTGTYLKMLIDGKEEEVDATKVIGVVQSTDTNTISSSRTALNSDFIAASALASDNKSVVLAEVGSDGKTVLVKGTVSGAYIDTISSATVKIKVDILDDNGNPTGETKTYDYGDIVRAGDLTEDEMDIDLSGTSSGTISTVANGTGSDAESSTDTASSGA